MASSASSSGSDPSKSPISLIASMSKTQTTSPTYSYSDELAVVSNKELDNPTELKFERPKLFKTSSHGRTSSGSSRKSSHSRSSSFGMMSKKSADGKRDPQPSPKAGAFNEEDEMGERPPMTKRHSSGSHKNVNNYTECGRHSDDWLFQPLTDTVKGLLGKK